MDSTLGYFLFLLGVGCQFLVMAFSAQGIVSFLLCLPIFCYLHTPKTFAFSNGLIINGIFWLKYISLVSPSSACTSCVAYCCCCVLLLLLVVYISFHYCSCSSFCLGSFSSWWAWCPRSSSTSSTFWSWGGVDWCACSSRISWSSVNISQDNEEALSMISLLCRRMNWLMHSLRKLGPSGVGWSIFD